MQRDDRVGPVAPSGDDGRSRRAGWLAVAATCVALTSIMIAATRIAGPDSRDHLLDGFPGPPTGGLLTVEPPRPAPTRDVPEPTAGEDVADPGPGEPTVTPAVGQDRGDGLDGVEPNGRDTGAEPGRPEGPGTRTGAPAPTTRVPPTANPTVSVVPPVNPPGVAADALVNATISFYDLLPHDVAAAWHLVGGAVRARGFAAFEAMWADVASVTVTDMRVVTDSSTVHVVAHVVRLDGSDVVEKYDLVFRDNGKLVIEQLSKPTWNGNEPAR